MEKFLQDIFDTFILLIQRGMVVLITFMSSSIIGEDSVFAPNMEAILKVIQPDTMLKLINFFQYAGLVVVIVMIFYSVFIRLFGNVMEIKDGLMTMFGRALVAIMLIFFLVHSVDSTTYDGLLDKVLVVGNNVYSNAITDFTEEDAMTADTDALELVLTKERLALLGIDVPEDELEEEQSVELGGAARDFVGGYNVTNNDKNTSDSDNNDMRNETVAMQYATHDADAGAEVLVDMVLSIIRLVLVIIMTFLMIKLMFEIIKHFTNIIGLYVMTPFMASFFVSSNTATITTSFLKMFCSEIIMMTFCRVWIIISLYTMYNYLQGVPGMFVVIGIIQFGNSIDNLLKNLGFATSNTGGALYDSVTRAGMSIYYEVSGAKKIAGGGFIAAGNALGEANLTKMGSLIKTGSMTPEAVARTQEMGVTGALKTRNLSSGKSTITPGEVANMKSLFDEGNMQSMNTFTQKYNTLSNANKQAINDAIGKGFESFSDSLASGSNFTISGIDGKGNAEYKVQSEDGSVLSEGSISKTKNTNALGSIPVTDSNGNQWYANVGEVASISGKNIMPKDVFPASPDYKADEAIRTASQMGLKNVEELDKIPKTLDMDGTHYLFDSDSGVVYYHGKGDFSGPARAIGHKNENGNYIRKKEGKKNDGQKRVQTAGSERKDVHNRKPR